jgi:hypothetical protein
MGIGKRSNARLEMLAAEKGIKRHRRDNARDAKRKTSSPPNTIFILLTRPPTVQRDRDDRFFAHCNTVNALRGSRFLKDFVASTAFADIGPPDHDTEVAEPGAADSAPAKIADKIQAKANRLRFKTFPKIVANAFPQGFTDNYLDPRQVNFFPFWDAEVVESLRLALDFDVSVSKSATRLQGYVLNLFEAAIKTKEENPALLPAGKLILPADRDALFDLVTSNMSPHIKAGGLPSFRYGLSPFALAYVIDGMAAARKAYLEASPHAKVKGTRKERYIIKLVDSWVESFGGGQFLLQELVVKSQGLMTTAFRPATE